MKLIQIREYNVEEVTVQDVRDNPKKFEKCTLLSNVKKERQMNFGNGQLMNQKPTKKLWAVGNCTASSAKLKK